jgi:hypothetical protein
MRERMRTMICELTGLSESTEALVIDAMAT